MESPADEPDDEPLRGEINPTEQMESFQESYLRAVVAAAGCTIAQFNIDDGIDAMIKHRSIKHLGDRDVYLNVQLKATHQVAPNPKNGKVSISIKNDRFELLATPNPTVNKILVAMIMPREPSDWLLASHNELALRHGAYWVNLAGLDATGKYDTVANAPTNQIFTDGSLCAIMERIGQGGAP